MSISVSLPNQCHACGTVTDRPTVITFGGGTSDTPLTFLVLCHDCALRLGRQLLLLYPELKKPTSR